MDKKVLFMSFNKKTGTISGVAEEDMVMVEGLEFPEPVDIKLSQSELTRFEFENDLQFNEKFQVYNFGGKNPLMLLTNCKFISRSNEVSIYSADTWEWI